MRYVGSIGSSRVINSLIASIGNKEEIKEYDDLEMMCNLIMSCEELYSLGEKYVSGADLEYYRGIGIKYGEIVKRYYYSEDKRVKYKKIYKEMTTRRRDESEDGYSERVKSYDKMMVKSFDSLARMGDFDSFITAMEWRRGSKEFYRSRREVLMRHGVIGDIQDLADGKIKMLIIEAPPGIGKSVCGELFCVYRMAMSDDCRGLIGNANASLTGGFYSDILDMMTSNEYRFSEIKGRKYKIITDAEDKAIYFDKKVREPNVLCRSIEVGATGKIHINSEGFLYMDDVVKNPEQANNKEYLDKLNNNFASTFYDRRENDNVPVLIIGTPWSLYDLIGFLKKKYGDKEWFRVNSIPCYRVDENGNKVTNFDYGGNNYKSVEYWEDAIKLDDPVIASAKYLMKPMERANRPFEAVNFYRLEELQTRIDNEDAFISGACDVAVSEGGDNLAMGIFYGFESDKSLYLLDVVYSNKGTDYTIPRMARKIASNRVELCEFEEKEGSVGKRINYGIAETVRTEVEKLGHKCLIRQHSGAGLRSKSVRIDTYSNEIRGESSIGGWKILYLHPDDRVANIEYNNAMNDLYRYSNAREMIGKQKDDFPDMLAMEMAYCIDGAKNRKCKLISGKF